MDRTAAPPRSLALLEPAFGGIELTSWSRNLVLVAIVCLIISAAVPALAPPSRASAPTLAAQASPLAPVLLGETPANGTLINTTTPVITVAYYNVTIRIAAVEFFLDGMNLSSAGTFNQTLFVLPLGLELRNGPHLAEVTVANVLGDTNSTEWGFTVDTTPPILLVTAPASPAVPTSTVRVQGTALLASPYFAGAAPITVTATVLPSGYRNATTAAADGPFSVGVRLSEGGNVIFVNATDRLGNLAVDIVKVLSDTVKPPITIKTPTSLVSPTSTVWVSGTTGPGDYVFVNGYSVVVNPLDGSWGVNVTLPDGLNIVTVVAADQVGNVNYTGFGILVDSDAPRVVLTSPTVSLTNDNRVVVAGTVADTALVELLVNANPVTVQANGSFSTSITLPDGADPIVVVAIDAAQHVTTVRTEIRVDTTAPVVTVAFPPDGLETNTSTVVLRGTVKDDDGAIVLVNGQMIRPDATGAWRTTVALLPGGNTILVSAVDPAGNVAAPIDLHVDYFSPVANLQNGTATNAQDIDALGALVRFSLVGIVILVVAVTLLLYSRTSRRIREDRRVLAELVRRSGGKP